MLSTCERSWNAGNSRVPIGARLSVLAVVCCLQVPGIGHAQFSTTLPSKFAEYSRPFTGISAVRELEGGLLLVVDRREREVVMLRDASDQGTLVGRKGDGPGEFRSPNVLIALPGDSTVLTDTRSGGRWLILRGATIVATWSADQVGMRRVGHDVSGADTRGHILALRGFSRDSSPLSSHGPSARDSDSAIVTLALLANGSVDTVARIRGGWSAPAVRVDLTVSGQKVTYLLGPLIRSMDQAAVCPDGAVAVVDGVSGVVSMFRKIGAVWKPEWRRDLVRRRTRVTEAMKRQFIDADYGRSVGKIFSTNMFPAWPETLPEIAPDGLWCPRVGEVVVARYTLPGSSRQYDIVSGSQPGVMSLTVPQVERFIEFGGSAVFVIAKDDDDLEHVRRYAWPLVRSERK